MGVSVNLINVSANDGWQTASNKINENFRNLYRALSYNGSLDLRSSETELLNQVNSLFERVRAVEDKNLLITNNLSKVNEVITSNTSEIKKIKQELDALKSVVDDLGTNIDQYPPPPVGTYINCEYDPNEQWEGTLWIEESFGGSVPQWKRVQ